MYLRSQWSRRRPSLKAVYRSFRSPFKRLNSLAQIKEDLLSRSFEPTLDYPTPIPAYLLSRTLQGVLPARYQDLFRDGAVYHSTLSKTPRWPPKHCSASLLDAFHAPPTYHLVYLPSPTRLFSLLPDGTDTLHSPGPPFTRRVWAGCTISHLNLFPLSGRGSPLLCHERVTDVKCEGRPGKERLFVHIERDVVLGGLGVIPCKHLQEIRVLAFMQEENSGKESEVSSVSTADAEVGSSSGKVLRAPRRVEFSHTVKLSAAMLFRFSALTFNAHAIHLNPQYCRAVEGHHNLLVHGPLTTILMAEMLRVHLADRTSQRGSVNFQISETLEEGLSYSVPRLIGIRTKNIAPLFADEPMTLCGRLSKDQPGASKESWELWIENLHGSIAARASASTSTVTHNVPYSEK